MIKNIRININVSAKICAAMAVSFLAFLWRVLPTKQTTDLFDLSAGIIPYVYVFRLSVMRSIFKHIVNACFIDDILVVFGKLVTFFKHNDQM